MLPNILMENAMHCFFQDSLSSKEHNLFCNIMKVFIVSFDTCNASLVNKSINSFNKVY